MFSSFFHFGLYQTSQISYIAVPHFFMRFCMLAPILKNQIVPNYQPCTFNYTVLHSPMVPQ